jgi:hypothetical protein
MWPAHPLPHQRLQFRASVPLFAFFLLPVVTFAQAAGNFSAAVNYSVPGQANGIALGAFVTGNSTQDVAVATGDSNVSILIGNGNGTFQSQYTVLAVPTTGPYSSYVTMAIAVADFNGDGNLDMAVLCTNSSGAGSINVLLGDGTGHFGAPTVIPLDGTDPVQILTGDFNNDGKADLVVLNQGSESVTVLLGNGDGTFNALPDTSIGLSGTDVMAVADFNKDGKLDLAVGDTGGVAVLLGNGDGTFQAVVNWTLPSEEDEPAGPLSGLVVGDFNNDGNPDIAASVPGDFAVYVLLGEGNGSFQSPPTTLTGISVTLFATADFNSDGNLDLATFTTQPYDLEIFLGTGTGSLKANAIADVGLPSEDGPLSINGGVAADVNGDGYPDLIMGTDGAVTVMLNCGLRCTTTALTLSTETPVFNQPVTFTAMVAPANAKATGTPTGTVTFQSSNGANPPVITTLGTVALSDGTATLMSTGFPNRTTTLFYANYSGDANFNSSTSAAQPPPTPQVFVTHAPTTVVTSSSADPSTPGQSVTLTATVTPSTSGVPTGTVTFSDNGTALVSQPMNSSGVATFTTSSLPTGTDSITAAYSGDSNFAASTSAAITQIVGTSSVPFTVSASPTSAMVSAGASATFTINLATAPSAKSAISLSCSGLPAGASCSFSPAQITPKGASAATTLTITTTGSGSVFGPFPGSPRGPSPVLPFAFLSLLVLLMLALMRKQQTQRTVLPALVLLCVFVILTGAVACGGNSSSTTPPPVNVTPSGTSKITVMASASGNSQTTTVSLTVN